MRKGEARLLTVSGGASVIVVVKIKKFQAIHLNLGFNGERLPFWVDSIPHTSWPSHLQSLAACHGSFHLVDPHFSALFLPPSGSRLRPIKKIIKIHPMMDIHVSSLKLPFELEWMQLLIIITSVKPLWLLIPETNTSRALIKISAQVTLPYPLFFFRDRSPQYCRDLVRLVCKSLLMSKAILVVSIETYQNWVTTSKQNFFDSSLQPTDFGLWNL